MDIRKARAPLDPLLETKKKHLLQALSELVKLQARTLEIQEQSLQEQHRLNKEQAHQPVELQSRISQLEGTK